MGPGDAQHFRRILETTAVTRARIRLNGGPCAFKAQLPGFPAEIADLGNGRAGAVVRQLTLGLFNRNQHSAALLARRRIVDSAEHEDAIRAIRKRTPILVAGNDPLVAFTPSTG